MRVRLPLALRARARRWLRARASCRGVAFRRLSTRLTVLYALLFGTGIAAISLAVFLAISAAAERQVRAELSATGTVFDRIWSLRSDRLEEGASLLSRDFGFLAAAATGDEPTVESALENLRRRLGVDHAFMLTVDGRIVGAKFASADEVTLGDALIASDAPSGVFELGGRPYQLVGAPVLSPELIGWVVFAVRLDAAEMRALEALAAIPLTAQILPAGSDRARGEFSGAGIRALLADASRGTPEPRELRISGERTIVLAKPLAGLGATRGAVLVLRYPMALALAPYRTLLAVVALLGLGGLAAVGGGSWALARSVARPISELDDAAQRLRRGEDVRVEPSGGDEVGRLAESFNSMAAEIRARERKIAHQAMHDVETGLCNRLALETVAREFKSMRGQSAYVAVLGLDRYSHMRHAIGHRLAAQAVRRIGNRLAGLAPGGGVARVSSDMLGFLLTAPGPEAALVRVRRLVEELERPVRVGGESIDIALSAGLSPLNPAEIGPSIERASIGLDQARAARVKAAAFDAQAYGDPAANLSLMSGLLAGIMRGELVLWHQPKFDLRRRKITATEALVRWDHPTRGRVFPDLFIPMAEETGHIRELTDWVITAAIADQARLADAGHEIDVAVNVSGRVLGEAGFADFCREAVSGARGRLCFEITETAVIENPDVALATLDAFAEMGVAISIDDYGSGLSSLAYLKQIRGHELKLDRSIVKDVSASQRDALIVRSTIDLAHSLGLKVVAEGIEDDATFSLLAAMGCDMAQGYHIARPMPLQDLLTFLGEPPAAKRRRA